MTANDLIAAFETLADAPDGVKRLRELVLQLAVRGKLVAQDPKDEAARPLLIRGRKSLSAQAEGIRRGSWRPTADVREDETPFELPAGWTWGRVNDTGFYINGLAFKPSDWKDAGRPIIRIQNLSDPMKPFNYAVGDFPDDVIVRKGELLVSWSATLETYIWNREDGVLNQHIFRVKPCDVLVAKPFLYYLLRQAIRDMADSEHAHGLVMAHINRGPFLNHVVAIPPLAEQHRIVARVDELMGLLDRLEAARTARDEVRRAARDAALAALRDAEDTDAVEAAWGRIAGRMDALFAEPEDVGPLRDVALDLGVRGRLGAAGSDRDWTALKLEELCTNIVDCLHRTPQYTDSGFPAIRTTDLRPGRILWETARRVPEHEFLEQTRRLMPEPGDVFYAREGNWGDAAVVPEGVPMCLSQRTMQFRLKKHVDPHFFAWLLNSRTIRSRVGAGTVGMTVPHVNIGDLRKLVLRIPPLAEQHRIVAKVDALMSICDALEASLATSRDLHGQFAAAAVHHLDV